MYFAPLKYASIMFTDLKRMRLVCGLRQLDVSFCTGVSVSALAAAEQGRKPLNYTEHALVVAFLDARWRMLQELETPSEKPEVKIGSSLMSAST
jgi:transcriptional regulator with XRE-family HTH domain